MGRALKILSVGHSYVVSMNRSILRELACDPEFSVTIGAPKVFKGSLRPISIEPEPENSKIDLRPLDVYLTQKMHIFSYNPMQLHQLFKENFDLAHFWEEPYILSGFELTRFAKRSGTPYLFRTAQSLIKNYVIPFSYFENLSLKDAKAFVAGGHLVYQAMREKGWTLPGKVLTLAVDTKRFKPFTSEQKKEKRKELKLKGPVIGYLGRLSEEKGCDLFMEALGALKDLPWSFLIMGSGPYKEKILTWVKEQGLNDRVQLVLLKHDEVPQVLPVCDLLICPSQTRPFWKEQFGRMIVEAFASGVPVMGSDSGEIPRVIDEAGVVLPEDKPQLWRDEIKKFLLQPEVFQAFREKGFARVNQFSAQTIAEQYKSFYRQVINA